MAKCHMNAAARVIGGCIPLWLSGPALAASFTFTTLPPNGADYSLPRAIKQNDIVVGSGRPFGSGSVAFVWQAGVITFVSALPAFYDINASGTALSSDPAKLKAYSLYNVGTGAIEYLKVKGDDGLIPAAPIYQFV